MCINNCPETSMNAGATLFRRMGQRFSTSTPTTDHYYELMQPNVAPRTIESLCVIHFSHKTSAFGFTFGQTNDAIVWHVELFPCGIFYLISRSRKYRLTDDFLWFIFHVYTSHLLGLRAYDFNITEKTSRYWTEDAVLAIDFYLSHYRTLKPKSTTSCSFFYLEQKKL